MARVSSGLKLAVRQRIISDTGHSVGAGLAARSLRVRS
jgi:hypothetical protein